MKNTGYRLERIRVTGIVQGVGFRPFVYGAARRYDIGGYILNDPEGVVIEAEGTSEALDTFVRRIEREAPVLSRITGLVREIRREGHERRIFAGFEIRSSEQGEKPVTLISPDVCICEDCLKELFDPSDRRYRYPFINCTNCGPRFTIIRKLPYDRVNTTMADFILCPDCSREYHDPSNRRFHAQPNACPECGPRLVLLDEKGKPVPGDPVAGAVELLREGRIVAVKGLGGFHLAVDGTCDAAVRWLRERKHRGEKPFALMVGNLETARALVELGKTGEELLAGRTRPIVLGYRKDTPQSAAVPESVAPCNRLLGVMLPYTPLHYLLFFNPEDGRKYTECKPVFTALVMTSANISEEPICKDNDEVRIRMAGIADAYLVHNRDIHVRCDDSVLMVSGRGPVFVRRSRGFAPVPVFLPEPVPQVLALGGEMKNTLCVTDGNRGFLSQHIGDLDNIPTLGFFEEAVAHFTRILDLKPKIFAYDLHPDYISTKYLMNMRTELDEKEHGTVGVQHHHAHIASVMAEHGYGEPVIGFSMDGTGYGPDGTVWGGEILLCTPVSYARFAHLRTVPLPGGTRAVREPWRMAFAHLRAAFPEEWRSLEIPSLSRVTPREYGLLDSACEAGVNSPLTSSLGRLFDAVASILNIRHESAYEGQAAMMLESHATGETMNITLPYKITSTAREPFYGFPELWGNVGGVPEKADVFNLRACYILDYRDMIRSIVDCLNAGKTVSEIAAAFHGTLVRSFVEAAEMAREITGIRTVAFSGGCWQNTILRESFRSALENRGFRVMTNRQAPVNDGGLSLGQAYVAGTVSR